MRFRLYTFHATAKPLLMCAVMLCAAPLFASHYHHGPTAGKHKSKGAARLHGASHTAKSSPGVSSRPRAMDDARASEIQTSLVKAGYLPSVSGHWDEASADAMRKLQGDNGWQTKMIPDSRALIKLGLGPTTSTLPASATTGGAFGGGAAGGGVTSNGAAGASAGVTGPAAAGSDAHPQ